MKTDRELLELAAKAAGISGRFDVDCIRADAGQGSCGSTCWNPLADDGDALRLAMTLGLVVDTYDLSAISGSRLNAGHNDWVYGDPDEKYDDDAATRRAIVRAAAAIGEGME